MILNIFEKETEELNLAEVANDFSNFFLGTLIKTVKSSQSGKKFCGFSQNSAGSKRDLLKIYGFVNPLHPL